LSVRIADTEFQIQLDDFQNMRNEGFFHQISPVAYAEIPDIVAKFPSARYNNDSITGRQRVIIVTEVG
jgi:hypothetical protein